MKAVLASLLLLLLFGSFLAYGYILQTLPRAQSTLDRIADVWYINLDRSVDRKKAVEAQLDTLAPLPIFRWAATDGSSLTDKDFDHAGVPNWGRPAFAAPGKQKQRANEIACFLSHRSLLEHLRTIPTHPDDCHLIVEDDIQLLPNLKKDWHDGIQRFGSDWDMIFLGYSIPKEVFQVKDKVGVPESLAGTYAYVVRHGSLDRILNTLQVVYDPIDEVYSRQIGTLGIYMVEKPLVSPGSAKSTIRS